MDNGESSYRRYLDGEDAAFDGILTLYFDNLTFFINRYVQDISAAEDLAIDSLLELMIHPKRYHFKTPLKTYLFTLGRNKAINYLKRRKRVVSTDFSGLEEIRDDTVSLEESVIDSEQKRLLNQAIAELPEQMRIAVHLVYFEGMSYEEAAKVTKKSRKQIDNLLSRAKTILRQQFVQEGKS